MQQPNSGPSNTNPIIEVALVVMAGLLILIGGSLLYLGKIDTAFASFIFMAALSLLGINLAYKAPSPTQQTQIGVQQTQLSVNQQNLQQLLSQALAVLPMFTGLLHSHGPVPPVAPPQPQQTAPQPAVQTPAPVPNVPPVANSGMVGNPSPPVQTQFRPSQLSDISMPLNVVIPPGQQQP